MVQNNQHQFVISNDWAATGRWPGIKALHLFLRLHIIKWNNWGNQFWKKKKSCTCFAHSRIWKAEPTSWTTTSWSLRGLDSGRNKKRSWSSWGKQTPWMFSHVSRAAHAHLSLEIGRRTRSLMGFPAPPTGEQGGKIWEESHVILPSPDLQTLQSATDYEHLLQWWDFKYLGSLREIHFFK